MHGILHIFRVYTRSITWILSSNFQYTLDERTIFIKSKDEHSYFYSYNCEKQLGIFESTLHKGKLAFNQIESTNENCEQITLNSRTILSLNGIATVTNRAVYRYNNFDNKIQLNYTYGQIGS